jgi:hypothetical protein
MDVFGNRSPLGVCNCGSDEFLPLHCWLRTARRMLIRTYPVSVFTDWWRKSSRAVATRMALIALLALPVSTLSLAIHELRIFWRPMKSTRVLILGLLCPGLCKSLSVSEITPCRMLDSEKWLSPKAFWLIRTTMLVDKLGREAS